MSKTNMKLTLTVKLIGDRKAKITLRFVKESLLSNISTAFENAYKDKETGIYIWSYQDFTFDEGQIRLPDIKYKDVDMTHTHKFATEKDRYETLKNYYKALNNWSSNKEIFPIQQNNILFDQHVTMFEDWWFIN